MKLPGETLLRAIGIVLALCVAMCFTLWSEERVAEVLQIGTSVHYKRLVIFPVISDAREGLPYEYLTLDEGLSSGEVTISEIGGIEVQRNDEEQNVQILDEQQVGEQQVGEQQVLVQQTSRNAASVNELLLSNNSGKYLYLMAGEVIKGAKQDRMVAHDIVFPPGARDVSLEVFCVESGRWTFQSETFASAKIVTGVQVRSTAQVEKSQSVVWDKVADYNRAVGATSRTGTLRAAYEDDDVQAEVEDYMVHLAAELDHLAGVVGLVAVVDGTISVIDVFGGPLLCNKLRDKLLTSYILDALASDDAGGAGRDTPTSDEIRRQVSLLASAEKLLDFEYEDVEIYQARTAELQGTRSFHEGHELHLNGFQPALF